MIEECNFKSKIRHRDNKPGCDLTPTESICPGEEFCILYKTYQNLENQKEKLKKEQLSY